MAIFAPVGSSNVTTSLQGVVTPTITTVTATLANTEYSYVLPDNTKKFRIRTREGYPLKVAYTLGDSGTTYTEVPRWCFYQESDLSLGTGFTIYFQSSTASQTVEIISWV